MMSERFLWDRFLFQIRESGMIPEGGTILDVGTGINTTTLEMFGDRWNVTPSDVNVGEWNDHIPGMIELDVMKLSEQLAGKPQYDALILSEVLEHVTDFDSAMYQACGALKPGGLLIVSVPFMYRIHEYGGDDTETSEPGLKDYWRFTPNGIAELFKRQKGGFHEFWVGRLVREDKKTFPEFYCPEGVVAWGRKRTLEQSTLEHGLWQTQHLEDGWNPPLPPDWREQQKRMAEEYERRIADGGEQAGSL